MTPKQKAAIKYNIKQKYLNGEITPDEYSELVAQLQDLAKKGASLQEANAQLGMYKSGKATKAQPVQQASKPVPMTFQEKGELTNLLSKKYNAGEITQEQVLEYFDKLDELKYKGATLEEAKAAVGLSDYAKKTTTYSDLYDWLVDISDEEIDSMDAMSLTDMVEYLKKSNVDPNQAKAKLESAVNLIKNNSYTAENAMAMVAGYKPGMKPAAQTVSKKKPITDAEAAELKKELGEKYYAHQITVDQYMDAMKKVSNMAGNKASLEEVQIAVGSSKAPITDAQSLELQNLLMDKVQAGKLTFDQFTAAQNKIMQMLGKKATFTDVQAAVGLDPGTLAKEKAEEELEKELKKVYGQAAKELKAQLDAISGDVADQVAKYQKAYADGTITADEYVKAVEKVVFTSDQLKKKIDQLTGVTLNANKKAVAMVNNQRLGVFAENANYQAYKISKDANLNLMFSIYDENTVEKLIKDKPELLPRKEVNGKKDKAWNKNKIANAMIQGILQGDSIPKLAKRVAAQTGETNMKAMVRYARTAMTAAQNSGRQEMLERAAGMGVKVKKVWMATLDSRTRDSHAALDGETVDVDKKFSNGLMYPGDPNGVPAEVYNCRCTLVYDYEGFPHDPVADQRLMYDEYYTTETDQDGKEHKVFHRESRMIQNMSYKEWKAAKEGGVLNDLNVAKVHLAEVQKAVIKAKINESKVYKDLWKDPVTLADYEAKKDGIQAKKDYYAAEIDKYEQAKAEGKSWATDEKIKELKKKQKLLNEFEQNGQLIQKRNAAIKAVQDIYTQVGMQKTAQAPAVAQIKAKKTAKKASAASGKANASTSVPTQSMGPVAVKKTPFGPEAYSQERKDKALWSDDKKYVDSIMRGPTGEAWNKGTQKEHAAIVEYTSSYSKFNEPLRGIEYGTSVYKGVGKTDLDAGYKHNGPMLNAMTDMIDKCSYSHDMWFQRGCGFGGMDKFFQCSPDLLRNGSQKELEQALLGTTPTEYGFMSMGSAKGQGFSGNILLNIYAPAGTKMMYAEPFSHYGGHAYNWDGKSKQSHFGSEFETIMQQGTQFRITKVERRGRSGTIYIDLEVINQDHQQRWKK